MTAVGPFYNSVTRRASLSSGFESPPDGADIPEETSPLLQPEPAPRRTISERWKSAWSSFLDDNLGLFLVVASQFFFSAMNMSVKWLNSSDEPVPILEITLVRTTISFFFSFVYMYWKNISDPLLGPRGVRTMLVLRGLSGSMALFGVYFSLQHLSLSDATVLTFLAPILTGFSGAALLKEPLSIGETLAGLCSFLGVVLISRPQFLFGSPQPFAGPSEITPTQRMLSVTAALIGVLGIAGSYLTLRAIRERVHTLHPVISFSSQSLLISTLGMILFKVPLVIPTRTLGLSMLFLNSIFGILGQIFLTLGLQRETAGRGALAIYTSIIFALVFELTVFHTTPPALSIIGILMILSSAIYITLTKKTDIELAIDSSPKRSPHGASASGHNGYPEA
ncbi:hypothetical protein BJY52DRAFT_1149260 [Lactarius psammicola]|nr:hypothetical protein BJY52DRAFT_1149260 [Lactarius psammicola]